MRTATLDELIDEAKHNWAIWEFRIDASEDELIELNKTREMVVALSNYFEGRLDDFCEARRVVE
jgi:hypothetical protein